MTDDDYEAQETDRIVLPWLTDPSRCLACGARLDEADRAVCLACSDLIWARRRDRDRDRA